MTLPHVHTGTEVSAAAVKKIVNLVKNRFFGEPIKVVKVCEFRR